MSNLANCPWCDSDQRDKPIPEEYLKKGYYGEWSEGDPPRYYWRTIMMEHPEVYDGGLYYQCPDCGERWHRWSERSPDLRARAERFVADKSHRLSRDDHRLSPEAAA